MITLPKLPYSYDALEPYIDAKTMEIHHTKHHQTYIDKLNEVLAKHSKLQARPIEELLMNLDSFSLPVADKTALRNHGGGYVNHAFFWTILGKSKKPDTTLTSRITSQFQTVDNFKEQFSKAAIAQFGSGWAWLAENQDKKLAVYSTPNQDSPLLNGHRPLIGLDVWEHAYYLRYQNRRAEYIENWWKVLKILP